MWIDLRLVLLGTQALSPPVVGQLSGLYPRCEFRKLGHMKSHLCT